MLEILRESLRKEGVKFLFKGWTPAFMRLGPNTVLLFVFMEVCLPIRLGCAIIYRLFAATEGSVACLTLIRHRLHIPPIFRRNSNITLHSHTSHMYLNMIESTYYAASGWEIARARSNNSSNLPPFGWPPMNSIIFSRST